MLMLLSSGARPRYRDDIVRALAIPHGLDLQFRYELQLVEPALLGAMVEGTLAGSVCLISFIKTSNVGGSTQIVPCRFADLLSAEVVGSSCILKLRLTEFASDEPDASLQAALEVQPHHHVPRWTRGPIGGDVLMGSFFFQADAASTAQAEKRKVAGLEGFEDVVRRLSGIEDFSDVGTGPFFHVAAVKLHNDGRHTEEIVRPAHGRYAVASGAAVDLEVYCFRPDAGVVAAHVPSKINVSCQDEGVALPFGSSAVVDSEYDVKTFRLITKSKSDNYGAPVRLFTSDIGGVEGERMDVTLPFQFLGDIRIIALKLALVAMGLAGPSLVGAYIAKRLDFGAFVLILAFGLVGALGAVFETLKPRK